MNHRKMVGHIQIKIHATETQKPRVTRPQREIDHPCQQGHAEQDWRALRPPPPGRIGDRALHARSWPRALREIRNRGGDGRAPEGVGQAAQARRQSGQWRALIPRSHRAPEVIARRAAVVPQPAAGRKTLFPEWNRLFDPFRPGPAPQLRDQLGGREPTEKDCRHRAHYGVSISTASASRRRSSPFWPLPAHMRFIARICPAMPA